MSDLRIEYQGSISEIVVRPGVLREIGDLVRQVVDPRPPKVCLITDEQVGNLYEQVAVESLRRAGFVVFTETIPPGEASKSLPRAEDLYQALARHELGRDGLVLALGGGVVSDLAGFVAATWLRGLRWAVCPTTLEADIDASVGGKTAVNISAGKNLVGAFHQPRLVVIDPTCLSTLQPRDLRAGMGESLKHALIFSEEFLSWQEANKDAILALDPQVTTELILRNVRIKADVVSRDALERTGARILLNFGHTIGHAIESCCEYRLRHGECVALGMLAAARLAHARGLVDDSVVDRIGRALAAFDLPVALSERIDTGRIIDRIRNDKKIKDARVQFVLLRGIGDPVVDDDVPEDMVREVYESLLS